MYEKQGRGISMFCLACTALSEHPAPLRAPEAALPSADRPVSVEQIEQVLYRMDSLHATAYVDFIQTEQNAYIVSFFLQRLSNDYPSTHFVNVIAWVTQKWTFESSLFVVLSLTGSWRSYSNTLVPFVKGILDLECFKTKSVDILVGILRQLDHYSYNHFLVCLLGQWTFENALDTLHILEQEKALTPATLREIIEDLPQGMGRLAPNSGHISNRKRSVSVDLGFANTFIKKLRREV
jgi:hypothetical protein